MTNLRFWASLSLVAAFSCLPLFANDGSIPQGASASQAQTSPLGAFQWSYPISLPPGTNSVQPSLSLTYNSTSPDGVLGLGFSLQGLSTIERDPSRGIAFTTTDSYLLDGQKLYRDTTDTANNFFHAERESYDQIQAFLTTNPSVSIADPNNANSYWVVRRKDGTKLFYGQTTHSRITALGNGLPRVWALNRVEDPLGNYYSIDYLQDSSTGAYYVLSISYTKNDSHPLNTWMKVQFGYEARNDHRVVYSPTKIDLDHRLKWIGILYNATDDAGTTDKLIRKYRIDYSSGDSAVTTIQEYGNDGNIPPQGDIPATPVFTPTGSVLSPNTLTWTTAARTASAATKWANSTVQAYANSPNVVDTTGSTLQDLIDVNGDGFPDLVSNYNPQSSTATQHIWVSLNDGTKLQNAQDWGLPMPEATTPVHPNYVTLVGTSGSNKFVYQTLLDMDGDGRPDRVGKLAGSTGTNLYVAHNNGAGFDAPQNWGNPLGNANGNCVTWSSSTGLVVFQDLVDMNGDGRPDRVGNTNALVTGAPTSIWVALNTGSGFAAAVAWGNPLGGTNGTAVSVSEVWGTSGAAVDQAFVDMDGDGRPDRVGYKNAAGVVGFWVARNNGSGFDTPVNWGTPIGNVPGNNENEGAYVKISNNIVGTSVDLIDMNGDGRLDRVSMYGAAGTMTANKIWVAINNGAGWNAPIAWTDPLGGYYVNALYLFLSSGITISDAVIMDMDKDGRPDRVGRYTINGITTLVVARNNGKDGFDTPVAFGNPLGGTYGDSVFWIDKNNRSVEKFVDMNGDGIPDRVGSFNYVANQAGLWVSLSGSDQPAGTLVTTITLPTGGTIAPTYTDALQVPGAIVSYGSTFPIVANGSPRALVTKIVVDPKLPGVPPISTSYEYFNGTLLSGLSQDRVDLGFQTITKIDDNTGTRIKSTFSQQPPFQGLPLSVLVTDNTGTVKYSESTTTYNVPRVINSAFPNYQNMSGISKVNFLSEASRVIKQFDGQSDSTNTKKTFDTYDAQGNLTQATDWGMVDSTGTDLFSNDNVVESYSYAGSYSSYLFRLIKKQTSCLDASGVSGVASETRYYYDGSSSLGSITRGLRTKVESVIDASNAVATSTSNYDDWGNVLNTIDSLGNMVSQTGYDTVYRNLPVSTTDARGLTTAITYSDGVTVPSSQGGYLPVTVTDSQGNVNTNVCDAFGRKVRIVSPLPRDTLISPTSSATYFDAPTLPTTPASVMTIEKTAGTNILPTYTYYDGLGRVVQTKNQAKVGGQWVTVDQYYDGSGRNFATSIPYLSSSSSFSYAATNVGSQNKTVSTFDALDRVVRVVGPDGNSHQTIYNQAITTQVDALNHVTQIENSGNLQIRRTYVGTFPSIRPDLSPTQGLYSTTTTKTYRGGSLIIDTNGNTTTTVLDMLGRKISYADPDMGTWAYSYDLNGDLIQQTDAAGNVVSFDYDTAGRVLHKSQNGAVVASYGYGTAGYQNGLLETIVQSVDTTSFTYDKMGRVTTLTKSIGTFGTRSQSWAYNTDGRLATKQFSEGGETLSYEYSPEGLISSLGGSSSYLSSITVDDFGRVIGQSLGNGTTTGWTFDPITARIKDIVTPGVLGIHYTFDATGNVLTKTDDQNSAAYETYTYDDQNRLKTASGLYGVRTYMYDALDNLMGKNGLAVSVYNGTKPHAVQSDGSSTYEYDANGNMTVRKTGATIDRSYSYDFENRLTSSTAGGATTAYTYDDTRQRTTITVGTATTVFWFGDYEETYTAGVLTETVKSYSANGPAIAQSSTVTGVTFLYTDRLGSISRARNSTGTVTARYYEPFGELAAVDDGTVRRLFTGQEWDASSDLYYYNARYYSATYGKFIQPDTMLDGLNRYAYCGNNPVNRIDPSGYAWWDDVGNFFKKVGQAIWDDFGKQLFRELSTHSYGVVVSTSGTWTSTSASISIDGVPWGPSIALSQPTSVMMTTISRQNSVNDDTIADETGGEGASLFNSHPNISTNRFMPFEFPRLPLDGDVGITSLYGMRWSPIDNTYKMHWGVDFAGATPGTASGRAVYPILSGEVSAKGYDGAWGNYVIIDHSMFARSVYVHLRDSVTLTFKEHVTQDTVLGYVGHTGTSAGTGAHLHFEWNVFKNSEDPLLSGGLWVYAPWIKFRLND